MDRRETNALKGMAIVLIVLHNVVHLLCPAAENEFAFSLSNVEFFFSNFPKHPITYLLSFYGWIGVSVFVFVSGYGLAAKYSEGKIEVLPWLSSHYVKLFLLLLPCMLALFLSNMASGDFTASDTTRYLLQQLLILNVFSPADIAPAPYWYLGMALQLYIVFLLIRNVSSKWLAGLGILFYILLAFSPDPMVFYLRHNFPGWFPEFILGILCWRYRGFRISRLQRLALGIVSLVAFIAVSASRYSFCMGGIFFMGILFPLREVLSKSRLIVWTGYLSASIYVVHVAVRSVWLEYVSLAEVVTPIQNGILVLVASIVLAVPYTLYYRYVLRHGVRINDAGV